MTRFALALLLLAPLAAAAQMHKCKDDRGRVYFSDIPCKGAVPATPPRATPERATPAERSAKAAESAAASQPAAKGCEPARGLHQLLQQWHGRLEAWREKSFLAKPSAKVDGDCLERVRVLAQWKQALEIWRRVKVLDEPRRGVLEDCRQLVQLLSRWRHTIQLWEGSAAFLPEADAAMCPARR